MHQRLAFRLFRGEHLAGLHVVLAIGTAAAQQIVVGHVEVARLVAREVAAAGRIAPRVAADAMLVQDGLNDGGKIDDAVRAGVEGAGETGGRRAARGIAAAAGGADCRDSWQPMQLTDSPGMTCTPEVIRCNSRCSTSSAWK